MSQEIHLKREYLLVNILSDPRSLVDWAGDPPTPEDWDRLRQDLENRLDLLRKLLPKPHPLGVLRGVLGIEDAAWLEGQYAQAVGMLGAVRAAAAQSGADPDSGRRLYGQALLWCARFDRNWRRRRVMARLMRLLALCGVALVLLAGLVGYQQLTGAEDPRALGKFLGGVVEALSGGFLWFLKAMAFLPGWGWLSQQGLLQALGLSLLGIVVSLAMGALLHAFRWRDNPVVKLLRLVLWSNLTIFILVSYLVLATGGEGPDLPETIEVTLRPRLLFFTFGYTLPILWRGGSLWRALRAPEVGGEHIWKRLRRAFQAFTEAWRNAQTASRQP